MDSVGFSRSSLFLSHLRKAEGEKKKGKKEKKKELTKTNSQICFCGERNLALILVDRIMLLGSSDRIQIQFVF